MVVEPPVPSAQPKRGLRILLAEDDDAMRNMIQQVLTRAGHTVVALEDGFELADYVELIASEAGWRRRISSSRTCGCLVARAWRCWRRCGRRG